MNSTAERSRYYLRRMTLGIIIKKRIKDRAGRNSSAKESTEMPDLTGINGVEEE